MSDHFRVIAIIAAFNEEDIISQVIGHLVDNGVDVYLLDNHSTDGTVDQARPWLGRGLLDIELFPPTSSGQSIENRFVWEQILRRKEELARTLPGDWFIHHDADEIREAPWPGVTLKEAIRWVDTLGYNAIDFRVLNFPPVDDGFLRGNDPRTYFALYEDGEEFDRIQLKCWKKGVAPPSLVPFGGHEVQFEGRRVFPIRFLLRHYPIRGQSHGRKKVFAERKGRFLEAEVSRGWHLQYNQFADDTHCFLRDPATLVPFDLDRVRLEQMLPDTNLRDLAGRVLRTDEALDRLRAEQEELRRHAMNLETERNSLRRHAATLEQDVSALRQHARGLETERDALKKHAAAVEQDRDSLTKHAATLKKDRDSLRQHAATLEKDRDSLNQHAVNLARDRDSLTEHAAVLARDRDSLTQHSANLAKDRDSLRQHATNLERELESLKLHAENLQNEIRALQALPGNPTTARSSEPGE